MKIEYVSNPNLPNKAELILLGEKYRDILEPALEKLGIKTLYVPDNPYVDKRISGHADISVLHLGGKSLLLANYLRSTKFEDQLLAHGFDLKFADIEQGIKYPMDADLNICIIGKKAICGRKNRITDLIPEKNDIIKVSQGYARCSVCVLNENAIICADDGIAEECEKHGIDVLKIKPGNFALDGYEYGFIGGSSFKIGKNHMAFSGTLYDNPNEKRILDFLKKYNIEAVYLTDQKAFDIGTAIPVIESRD